MIEFFGGEVDVSKNFSKEALPDELSTMKRYRSFSAIGMNKSCVASSLANLLKALSFEETNQFFASNGDKFRHGEWRCLRRQRIVELLLGVGVFLFSVVARSPE